MISPELLRRYAFFSHLDENNLKAVAMLSDEEAIEKGMVVFDADQPAEALYFLVEGSIELHYVITDAHNIYPRRDFYTGNINPGEPFGISALIEPFRYTATTIAGSPCRILKVDAEGLRTLCDRDPQIAAMMMRQLARIAMERLHDARIQLIAAQP